MNNNKDDNKTYRTQQFVIKKGHPLNAYFMEIMKKGNNLYNATNFTIKQIYTGLNEEDKSLHALQLEVLDLFRSTIPVINKHNSEKFDRLMNEDIQNLVVFKKPRKVTRFNMPTVDKNFPSYELVDAVFKKSNNIDYKSLPAHVNQGVMKQVFNDWNSFFKGLAEYKINPSKFKARPKPPRYKTKGGATSLVFSNQVCKVKDGKFLRFPKTNEVFNLSKHLLERIDESKFVEVRVQKFYDDVKLEVVLDYSKNVKKLKKEEDVKNVMAIDIGVNNLATCVSNNGMQPIIFNGKPLKSRNQYYNKLRSRLYSDLRLGKNPKEGSFTSKRLEYIDMKKHLKTKDFLHKVSKQIVDVAISNKIDKVIVGINSNWKQDVKMKKASKQMFINIPFATFLNILEYKLNSEGIIFEKCEESYTSQSSFLDNDPIPTYGDVNIPKFSGRRVTRGLYVTKNNISVNADVNAACNILKKHFDDNLKICHKLLSNPKNININNGKKKATNTIELYISKKIEDICICKLSSLQSPSRIAS